MIEGAPLSRWRFSAATTVLAALVGIAAVQASASPKIGFYFDELERTRLLYVVVPSVIAGLFLVLRFPRLALGALIFLVPFNTVGGEWGDAPIATIGKIAIAAALFASLLSTALTRTEEREWLVDSALGQALVCWLLMVGIAVLTGFFSSPNRGDWLRESNWMLFYAAALPAGTLVRSRRELFRVLSCGAVAAAVMQLMAFWLLATGHRFSRSDFEGGETFFRAPFPALSALYLYLAAALFLFDSAHRGLLSRRQRVAVLIALVALAAGLLATMGRGLWISVALGLLPLLALVPWNRRTLRAAILTGVATAAALGIVAAIDSLSAESGGNWIKMAWDFLVALEDTKSASTAGRALEWAHAVDVWKHSPLLGLGFGYPYPDNPYNVVQVDPFYMHNSYLNILAKTGLAGLFSLLLVFGMTLRRAIANARDPRGDTVDRAIAVALVASLAQMFVIGLFVPLITTSDAILGLAIEIGLVAAQARVLAARAPA